MTPKDIEKIIQKIYKEVFNKVYNKSRLNDIQNKKKLEQYVTKLQTSEQFDKFAKEFSKKLALKGVMKERGIWRKYFEAAKKKGYVALTENYSEFQKKIIQESVKENFKMIKSIPNRVMEVYQQKFIQDLMNEVMLGDVTRGSFEKELKKHGVTHSKLIARTEAAKLQTSITEHRAKQIGSVAYRWISSRDMRTRPSHRTMNGVIVFWRPNNQKPLLDNMRGNAGEFPNCRCDCQPILDEDDLMENSYQVYNYKIDKVVRMSKKELLNNLENKEIK